MGMVGSTRAGGARLAAFVMRVGALAVLGLCAAGCATAPQGPMAAATAQSTAHGPTVAFESIDGPPQSIFNHLVQYLDDEAHARQLAVVTRQGPAQFRVRGYLAALVHGRRRTTVIAWVWDVYDADRQRALRISGEEPASSAGRGTWAAADDGVLRRIAANSMSQLAAFLAAPEAPPAPPPAPAAPGPSVAANGDAGSPSATLAYTR